MNQLEIFGLEGAAQPQVLSKKSFAPELPVMERRCAVVAFQEVPVVPVSVATVPVVPVVPVATVPTVPVVRVVPSGSCGMARRYGYGKCRLCGGSIAIPGLDRSLCTNGCGWVIPLQVVTGGGR
jgi:hypothetical protein